MLVNMSDDGLEGADAVASEDKPVLVVRRVRPAYEQVAAQLRDLIIRGRSWWVIVCPWSPSSALFGVSRSTIREVFRVLSSQNLITTRRGVNGGTFVMKPESEQVQSFLETSLGLMAVGEAISIDELIEVRELLEVPAARLAAARRTDAHVKALQALLGRGGQPASGPGTSRRPGVFTRSSWTGRQQPAGHGGPPIFGVLDTRIDREGAGPGFWNEVLEDHRRSLPPSRAAMRTPPPRACLPISNFSGSATAGSSPAPRHPAKRTQPAPPELSFRRQEA